jgi:hypothetical protein
MTIGDNSSSRTPGCHVSTAGSICRASVTPAQRRGSFSASDTAQSAVASIRLQSESSAHASESVNDHSLIHAASSWH